MMDALILLACGTALVLLVNPWAGVPLIVCSWLLLATDDEDDPAGDGEESGGWEEA
jgi:hypothetical protein